MGPITLLLAVVAFEALSGFRCDRFDRRVLFFWLLVFPDCPLMVVVKFDHVSWPRLSSSVVTVYYA